MEARERPRRPLAWATRLVRGHGQADPRPPPGLAAIHWDPDFGAAQVVLFLFMALGAAGLATVAWSNHHGAPWSLCMCICLGMVMVMGVGFLGAFLAIPLSDDVAMLPYAPIDLRRQMLRRALPVATGLLVILAASAGDACYRLQLGPYFTARCCLALAGWLCGGAMFVRVVLLGTLIPPLHGDRRRRVLGAAVVLAIGLLVGLWIAWPYRLAMTAWDAGLLVEVLGLGWLTWAWRQSPPVPEA